MDRLINRRQQGDLGEASAIEWLTGVGATVLIPFGHSPDYDLVAEIDGHLIRVQVKTCASREHKADGDERWPVQIATLGGNQSWSGLAKRFDPAKVDYLFVLVGDGRRWFMPADALEARNEITVGGRKYSEFEIASGQPIEALVYGVQGAALESKRPTGEYPSGQRTATVNRQPLGFAGSNPASPIASPKALGPAKGERKLGRAGQAIVREKRQMTFPHAPFAEAGLAIGDRLRFRADGSGRVVIERIEALAATPAPAAAGPRGAA